MHQNEVLYNGHLKFDPCRFLSLPKLANEYASSLDYLGCDRFSYGAGRRVCPDVHLAERSMWRITAVLQTVKREEAGSRDIHVAV